MVNIFTMGTNIRDKLFSHLKVDRCELEKVGQAEPYENSSKSPDEATSQIK